jgi:hypothetical protein
MKDVSDSFLLQMAEVSAGLFGLFLVGMLFFLEAGFRHLGDERKVVVPYYRSSTKIVLVLFAIPVGVSFTLVVLDIGWSIGLFIALSVALVAANVDTASRIPAVREQTGSTVLWLNEILGSIGVLVIVALPWILGGLDPTREDLTWAILVSFATAFASLFTMVMSVFDIAGSE